MSNIVKLTQCTVLEDARLTPAKARPDGTKVDARLWLRVKESETEAGWFSIWPIVIWGVVAEKMHALLKKGAVLSHLIATCKIRNEKDDAGNWSNYVELQPVRDAQGTYRTDAIGSITQPVAEVAAPVAGTPDLGAILAQLGPQGLALLAQLAANVGANQAVTQPKAAPTPQPTAQRSSPASELDPSFFSDPGDGPLEDNGDCPFNA